MICTNCEKNCDCYHQGYTNGSIDTHRKDAIQIVLGMAVGFVIGIAVILTVVI